VVNVVFKTKHWQQHIGDYTADYIIANYQSLPHIICWQKISVSLVSDIILCENQSIVQQ